MTANLDENTKALVSAGVIIVCLIGMSILFFTSGGFSLFSDEVFMRNVFTIVGISGGFTLLVYSGYTFAALGSTLRSRASKIKNKGFTVIYNNVMQYVDSGACYFSMFCIYMVFK